MTTMVAVYMTAGAPRAMAVDVGTGGSNAEVWKAVSGALPEGDELGATAERLRHHGLAVRDDGRTLEVDDPWGTVLRLAPAVATPAL